jgi:uncharacterized membrane protein
MRANAADEIRIEAQLAHLLDYGTWLATGLITLGLIGSRFRAGFLPPSLVNAGVLLFIALPVVRVLVMLWNFVRLRERRFALCAVAVLAIMTLGLFLGAAG